MSGRADIAWSRQLAGITTGQASLWVVAALFVSAAHVGGAWWAMLEPPVTMSDEAPPAAIMIDLAPAAMAPVSPEQQVAADEVDSVESEAPPTVEPIEPDEPVETVETAEPVETTEPVEEAEQPDQEIAEAVEPEPVETPEEVAEVTPETPPEEAVDPVDEMIAAELDNVEVPLPVSRPEPVRPQPVKEPAPRKEEARRERPAPPKKQAAAPSRAAVKAQTQAQPAEKAAAPQSSRGATASISPARWQSRLLSHLERRKRYPASARRARRQGTAQVRFSIDANGNVQSVSLASSSGVPELDEEVVAMVRRASPVPAPPPGVNRTIVVPVRFSLR